MWVQCAPSNLTSTTWKECFNEEEKTACYITALRGEFVSRKNVYTNTYTETYIDGIVKFALYAQKRTPESGRKFEKIDRLHTGAIPLPISVFFPSSLCYMWVSISSYVYVPGKFVAPDRTGNNRFQQRGDWGMDRVRKKKKMYGYGGYYYEASGNASVKLNRAGRNFGIGLGWMQRIGYPGWRVVALFGYWFSTFSSSRIPRFPFV